MTSKSVLALVVSSPGDLQNGLLALVTTISQISAVLVAEDIESALRLIENHRPALVLLDMSSLEVQNVINEIKSQWPYIHLIVLAEDIAQGKDADATGADSVLIKGFPAQKLVTIVENIIDCREEPPPVQVNPE